MGRLASTALLGVGLAFATFAFAQGKKGPRAKGPQKPEPAAAVKESKGPENPPAKEQDAGASTPEPATTGGEAAENPPEPAAPPPRTTGGKLSPLNPRPEEFPDGGAAPPPLELDKVLGEIAALRARVAAVADTLFHSRIAIKLE